MISLIAIEVLVAVVLRVCHCHPAASLVIVKMMGIIIARVLAFRFSIHSVGVS